MKVAIVTGANKGIGFEITRGLMQSGLYQVVYLTARNVELGKAAMEKLNKEEKNKCNFHQLDVRLVILFMTPEHFSTLFSDEKSVSKFLEFIKAEHGGFDCLVQNAGFAFKSTSTEPRAVQAVETLKINFWGLLDIMKKFYPIARDNARIVLMSSFISQMTEFGFPNGFRGNPLAKELNQLNKDLTLSRLEGLVREYENDCKLGKEVEKGWPSTSYGLSKLFVNGVTRCYGYV